MSVGSLASQAREVPVGTDADLAYAHLAEADPILRFLVSAFGPRDPFKRYEEAGLGDHFAALVRLATCRTTETTPTSILYARIRRTARGLPSAGAIAALGTRRLAELGLPYSEADHLVRLAFDQMDGRVDLNALSSLSDQRVRALLAGYYGLGRWTVDMFLIRRLHRPDVLPPDDLALGRVIGRYWLRGTTVNPAAVDRVTRPWAPFRTYAAALLWSLSRAVDHSVPTVQQGGTR